MNNIISANLRTGVEGHFRLEVLRSDGSVKEDTGFFRNLILNQGLDNLFKMPAVRAYYFIQVGFGNGAPSVTDTALQSHAAGINSFSEYHNDPTGVVTTSPRYYYDQATVTFATGAVVGNVAEIGAASSNTGPNTLFSRALVKDSNGDPTTVSVLADEQLRVTYQLRWYIPEGEATGTLDLGEQVVKYAIRASFNNRINNTLFGRPYEAFGWLARNSWDAYAAGATLAPLGTAGPTGSSITIGVTPAGAWQGSYVNGSFSRTCRATFSPAQITSAIGGFHFNPTHVGPMQVVFDPPIAKTNTKRLSLDITSSISRYAL